MNDPLTDAELIARVAAGDRGALGELASRYESALLGLAFALTGRRRELALDAVQDCWLRVLRSAGTYRGSSSVKTWLWRIVINRCHDLRGSAAERRSRSLSHDPASGSASEHSDGLEASERLGQLTNAVDALSPEKRLVVLLCYQHGMTIETVADVLDVPAGTVKSRLHAALTTLRARLSSDRRPVLP